MAQVVPSTPSDSQCVRRENTSHDDDAPDTTLRRQNAFAGIDGFIDVMKLDARECTRLLELAATSGNLNTARVLYAGGHVTPDDHEWARAIAKLHDQHEFVHWLDRL